MRLILSFSFVMQILFILQTRISQITQVKTENLTQRCVWFIQ
ncbi:hypothetical protein [Helicobacter bilis]|nr:hypothetical protein [Helicobacter bilis]